MTLPGTSLLELQEKFHLSRHLLDSEVRDENLREISRIIDDHETLGYELGFTAPELVAISSVRDSQFQRFAMLRRWKQKFAWKATYSKLIESLLKCSRADLAKNVCQLLTQGTSPSLSLGASHVAALSTSLPSKCGDTSTDGTQDAGYQLGEESASSAPPDHRQGQPPGQIMDAREVSQPKVREEATTQTLRNVKELEVKFEDLLIAAYGDLERMQVPILKIRQSLYRDVHLLHTQRITDLLADHRHEIEEARTVEDLLGVLSVRKFWDFLNPKLLSMIINTFCSEGILHKEKEYLDELQQFRKMTTLRQFAKVCNVSTLSPKFSEVALRMGEDWDNATLEDVENFESKASETRTPQ